MKRFVIAGVAAMAAALAIVSAASAAKPEIEPVALDCGADGSFQIASYGNGGNSQFTPAHVIGTHQVVIPVSFSNVHGSFVDENGETQTFEEPDVTKGGAPANADLLDCRFSISVNGGPGQTFSVEGDVVLFIRGK